MFFRRRKVKASAPPPPPIEPRPPAELDPAQELQACLAASVARLNASVAQDGAREFLSRHYAPELQRMEAAMMKVADGLKLLSVQSAHGAVHLDPNALSRILDRMDNLGDATLRQIEGRIGVTNSRKNKSRLQALRDDMRDWLMARDAELQKAQLIVDELSDRAGNLRKQSLITAHRLAEAADTIGLTKKDSYKHVSPDAAAVSAHVWDLLVSARFAESEDDLNPPSSN